MIELLNMDCMDYMADCEDNAFDLAIVDPPYGIGHDGGSIGKSKFDQKSWDRHTPDYRYFSELGRVAKNYICWGGNYFSDKLAPTGAWIYWDKMHDRFSKTFAAGELAYTTFKHPLKQFTYKYQGNYIGLPNAITIKSQRLKRDIKIHPTQKPIALYEWLLETYSAPGQRILDTHLGSGSSAIAAHYFGCDFVGTELDPDYFKAAQNRFDHETRQISFL